VLSMPSPVVWLGVALALAAFVLVGASRRRVSTRLLLVLVVLVAGLWRVPAIDHGLPYLSYIDEGHVLHRSARMLEKHTPFPGWYQYPSLTMDGAAALAAVYATVPGARPVTPSREERNSVYYDLGMPSALVVAGRV